MESSLAFELDNELLHSDILYNKVNKQSQIVEEVTIIDSKQHRSQSYFVFLIQCTFDRKIVTVERRFSHFDTLNQYLQNTNRFQGVILPQLPNKQPIQSFLNKYVSKSNLDMNQRKAALQKYLDQIQKHSVLIKDKAVIYFLTEENINMCEQTILLENNIIPQFQQQSISDYVQYAKAYLLLTYDTNKYTEEIVDQSVLQGQMQKICNVQQILKDIQQSYQKIEKSRQVQVADSKGSNTFFNTLLNRFTFQVQNEEQDSYLYAIQTLIANIDCAKIAYYKLTKVIQEFSIQLQMYQQKMYQQKQQKEGISHQKMKQQEDRVGYLRQQITSIHKNLTFETQVFEKGLKESLNILNKKLIIENITISKYKDNYMSQCNWDEVIKNDLKINFDIIY